MTVMTTHCRRLLVLPRLDTQDGGQERRVGDQDRIGPCSVEADRKTVAVAAGAVVHDARHGGRYRGGGVPAFRSVDTIV